MAAVLKERRADATKLDLGRMPPQVGLRSLSTDPLAHWRRMAAIRRTLTVPLGKP